MISSFEVGALFVLRDEMSAGLKKILDAMRALNAEIKTARESMLGFGGAISGGLSGAIGEINLVTAAWERAGAAAVSAAAAGARVGAGSAAGAAAGGAGGGFRPGPTMAARGGRGGGGIVPGIATYTGPGVPTPGGGRISMGGTPAMAAAAVLGLSLYEAANMELDVKTLNYHLGRESNKQNDLQAQKFLQDTMTTTGLGLPQVGKSVTDIARMMRDVPGYDVLKEAPRLLRAAQTEAILKGTTLDESVKSIIGLTHSLQAYKPGEMEKLYQVFAYASVANPAPLGQMEKTLSYVLPTLRAGADMDPKDIIMLSTVLGTSGVTQSKGGTWLRELGVNLMPGKPKHNELLTQLGLLDANGKPTWFVNGKPNMPKALEIAGPIAAAMPPEERLKFERELFGARGAGAFAVLGGETARERYKQMRGGMDDPANETRYNAILGELMGTTKMQARTTIQEFNVALIELGTVGLPLATAAIKGLSAALGYFTGGHKNAEIEGWKPNALEKFHDYLNPGNWFGKGASALPQGGVSSAPSSTPPPTPQGYTGGPPPAQPMNFLQGPGEKTKATPISLSLNVDGRVLAQSISEQLQDLLEHATGSPNYNGMGNFPRADSGLVGT